MALDAIAESIVKRGFYEARLSIAGLVQKIRFSVTTKEGAQAYLVLHTDKLVGLADLVKIAEETHLPVESPNGIAFPKGKTSKDFSVS
ncbi:MAG: hypothetical protein ACP5GD_03520 [Candidatus Micrarchaeia archaeon]|jgi:hypothetical protein